MEKRWVIKNSKANIEELSRKSFISKVIAKILVNRNISTTEEIEKFLKVSLDDTHDPFLMEDMDKGTDIISEDITAGNKIAIYGDYDVDGVASTTILYIALKKIGANVIYYIPDREKDGYGLNENSLYSLKEQGVKTILTCDNGIAAINEVKKCKEFGMNIVITDHHDLPYEDGDNTKVIIPKADAVINPKRLDCNYPFKLVCGATVAYKFSLALYIKRNIDTSILKDLLVFAGVATICDVVDLIDENRVIAKYAIDVLNGTVNNVGMRALIEACNLQDKEINSYSIGFVLGPCINASGRLETAKMAVDLFVSKEYEKCIEIAKKLVELNKTRKMMTEEAVESVIKQIENSDIINDKVLVVLDKEIHESLAGIIAGRIKERYNRPTIVLTSGSNNIIKGSGRSIEEYNMFEELTKVKENFLKFGGHPMAAGMSLESCNVDKLRRELNENCALDENDLIKKYTIDCSFKIGNINNQLVYDINMLEPFGKGNHRPVLGDKGVEVNKILAFGEENNVIKFEFANSPDGMIFENVENVSNNIKAWYGEEYGEIVSYDRYKTITLPVGCKMDILYSPTFNKYNGNINIQLKIVDYRKMKV
ncbi:single-stranded-DNA-specific exonuclease RecJ [Clostridium bornimense]|uniref:single-stranded-DNA-specific exonuclease RecJ n=1 Tax=Clostridium bornimense TaxID=1216932 RepID=UPI001C12791B|nr:single-stranded-DNA-specific exonuclease RecJ [Clostridium bornimense]MBU5314692.1 single-stranded-DNA-specific exonuclease RecJ [Clostridium bornimense]